MTAPIHRLHEVTTTVSRYRFPLAKPSPADERCFVCQRTFGVKDDPGDRNEVACKALCFPCGHLVGSSCVEELLTSTNLRKECHLCRTPLQGEPVSVPQWMQWVSETAWFQNVETLAAEYVNQDLQPKMTHSWWFLTGQLFRQDLTVYQALRLWSYHACGVVQVKCSTLFWFYVWYAPPAWLGYFLDGQHPELWLVSRLLGCSFDTRSTLTLLTLFAFILTGVLWAMAVHQAWWRWNERAVLCYPIAYYYASLFVLIRVLTVVLLPWTQSPFRVLCVCALGGVFLYWLIAGVLILHGMKWRRWYV